MLTKSQTRARVDVALPQSPAITAVDVVDCDALADSELVYYMHGWDEQDECAHYVATFARPADLPPLYAAVDVSYSQACGVRGRVRVGEFVADVADGVALPATPGVPMTAATFDPARETHTFNRDALSLPYECDNVPWLAVTLADALSDTAPLIAAAGLADAPTPVEPGDGELLVWRKPCGSELQRAVSVLEDRVSGLCGRYF